jgi:release factor glutamine methyltransferase
MTTVTALLREARERIAPADAELLLAHALARSRTWLLAHGDDDIAPDNATRFLALVERRVAGEPVAYLAGSRGFWTLDLAVTPATLVPRPETELLVELALERIPVDAETRVADLGTGSGAIALAIAKERPRARVVATDASGDALEVARGNAKRNGIGNVEFRRGDWLAPLPVPRSATPDSTSEGMRARASSTSSSVSGRGMRVAGVTARSSVQNPREPVR